ncbi:ScbA/BarX family gamma-butyrolactone biosynthesis protein [Streptomyces lancefieldiae]|uniref:ScbA/BarX family gamma-butyrolactone biosynthesis protein n=1 Tax=Streptomyces lancefieldiae TaxID=3075520 RepID=A0ABU3B0M6_9ACTN|nr:ScbA/BarX family gamma-butyrolactone biosynthesis protein [Streptomyces sp. DSM 40712]MDT0615362.1 ScbA/BarX family gamma-butyrolactone biosynthesis protein [Streptomyces sp. DSM 40712]
MLVHTLPSRVTGPTVPPHYVHKRNISEVFLTSWDNYRPDSFVVSARWPSRHRFYLSQNGLHDPLLFVESVRQCFPLLSHAGYDLPFGHHLIWQYLSYEVTPSAMRIGTGPTDLDLHITCSGIRRRHNGELAAVTLHVTALRDGKHLGRAQARFSCHAPSVYRRLRGRYAGVTGAPGTLPPAEAAHLVARDRDDDVVLSPTGHRRTWLLRNNTSHPVLFDHPVDHSPGMLFLEASRQAAHAYAHAEHAYPVKVESTFFQFNEFDAPCRISVEEFPTIGGTGQCTQVLATQNGEVTFSSVVTALVRPPVS